MLSKRLTIATLALVMLAGFSSQRALRQKLATLVNNLGLDATRSFTVAPCNDSGDCYSTLVLTLNHSVHNSATAIAMSCTATVDDGTTDATLQECAVANGVCTSSDASWSKAVSGTAVWAWRVDVRGYPSVTCTITDTGGDAADKITVKGVLVTW